MYIICDEMAEVEIIYLFNVDFFHLSDMAVVPDCGKVGFYGRGWCLIEEF